MKNLHVLPKFSDRWSHLYLEHGRLEQEAASLAFYTPDGKVQIPICQLGLLMLGPGTCVTHQAMKALADHNCLVCWTGEQGVRMYAHSSGGTHSSRRLLKQAQLYCDPESRLQVVRRMYQKRFPEPIADDVTIVPGSVPRNRRSLARPQLRSGQLELERPYQPRPLSRQRLPLRPMPCGRRLGRLLRSHRLHPHRQDALLRL